MEDCWLRNKPHQLEYRPRDRVAKEMQLKSILYQELATKARNPAAADDDDVPVFFSLVRFP
jgi:hypothetical protein